MICLLWSHRLQWGVWGQSFQQLGMASVVSIESKVLQDEIVSPMSNWICTLFSPTVPGVPKQSLQVQGQYYLTSVIKWELVFQNDTKCYTGEFALIRIG